MAYSKKNKYKEKTITIAQPIEQENVQTLNKNTKIYTTTSRLNLRKQPGLDKKIITIIPKGDQVSYGGYAVGNWYYVKYKDYIGFCLKDWLQ